MLALLAMLWDFNPLLWVWRHLTAQISVPRVDLTGRTCLVTGANQGQA